MPTIIDPTHLTAPVLEGAYQVLGIAHKIGLMAFIAVFIITYTLHFIDYSRNQLFARKSGVYQVIIERHGEKITWNGPTPPPVEMFDRKPIVADGLVARRERIER